MKKIFNIAFLILLLIGFKNVSALENDIIIVNSNNVNITEERFLELMDAGYTINDIYNMTLEEYNNANTNNPDIVSTTKYLKTISTTRYGITNSETYEITQEEYEMGENENISFFASGTSETTYKRLTASINSSSNGNNYKTYRAYLYWKTMPATRSHDIMSMGFDSTIVDPTAPQDFSQLYTINGITYVSDDAYIKEFNNGLGTVFQLPTSKSVITLCQDMTFEVTKLNQSTTITSQYGAGDYAHATETVSATSANNNYMAGSGGLTLYSAITNKYDSMQSADVYWTGTW